MKKKKLNLSFLLLLICLVIISPLLLSATNEERKEYKLCLNECVNLKKESNDLCNSEKLECKDNCPGNRLCASSCSAEKNECLKNSRSDYTLCKNECRKIVLPKCMNGNVIYNPGDKFQDNCDICECRENGKISCKREAFCNKNSSLSKEICAESGGLHAPLCNGPYFSIICSQEKLCLCEGINNYSCPSDYECLKDFISPNKRKQSIKGWKDLLGNPLGDIGVCVK